MSNNIYKVILVGTTSSGKTTLLNALREEFFIIPEIAEELLRLHPELLYLPDFQSELNRRQIAKELQVAEGLQNKLEPTIICDSGVVANLAYSKLYGQPVDPTWVDWAVASYQQVYLLNSQDIHYEKTTPLQEQLGGDIAHWKKQREKIDLHIQLTLWELNIPHFILSGTVEERATQVRRDAEAFWRKHQETKERL